MTTWQEALDKIEELEDWTYRDGLIVWSKPDDNYISIVFPKIASNSLDPKLAQLEKKMSGDVDFSFDINDSSGIYAFLDAWMKNFPDDWIDIDSVPRDYIYPVSYDWTPQLRKSHSRTNISKTSLARWWGQDADRLVDTGIRMTDAFDGDDAGVLYRMREEPYGMQRDLENVVCPFCLFDTISYVNVYKLPSVNEQYHGNKYYLLSCNNCNVVVECLEKKKLDVLHDIIWNE